MGSRRKIRRVVLTGIVLGPLGFLPAAAAESGDAADAPPDLRLEWTVDGEGRRDAAPIVGRAGETVRQPYRLRNVGGGEAFAAVVAAHTTLGPAGESIRREPGPESGSHFDLQLDLPLAVGVREVCLEARLQTLAADDPQDPNPEDNRLCRRVEVRSGEAADEETDEAGESGGTNQAASPGAGQEHGGPICSERLRRRPTTEGISVATSVVSPRPAPAALRAR